MEQKKGFTKDFWLVVAGQIISLFGNSIMRFALPIHLLNVTGSAALLGIVSGFAFLPLAVMAPIGGMIADRVNKRNIMVFLDFFTSGLTVLFLILYGRVSLTGLVLVMLFMLYGISGAYQPSVQASIPVLVDTEHVMTANAVINMISSLSGLLGPALGGIAYSLWGIYPILYVAALCFFISAVMEIFIHIPFVKRTRMESILREMGADLKESLSFIMHKKPEIGKLTLCCAGVNMVLSALMIIGLPVIVMQLLDFSTAQASRLYGFMQGVLAIGGLIGGIGAGALGGKLEVRKSWKLLGFCGILLIPMGITLFADCSPWVAYIVLAAAGMTSMALAAIYTIQIMSYIQITVPQEIVGKVISWVIAVSTCAQPIGQVVYGILFEQLKRGAWIVFMIAAICSIGIAIYNKKCVEQL
ncbi:MAG: MFS transporter [Faecalicatena sp.]|uniref:MFS transporter n=1 Tax=Faecalicatena sp. TaxID=2005360 RepID=UPI0025844E28|nr:MFS transporter [Faecalicatena sp.]MCI6467011.1 MFS transporter [Faecalicatena sp.]MCI7179849.1 MFS transporter [Lachnospiraceae bacterium]MDY5620751.1 MFS transporter [Lachnospiraceae bacterium]